MCWFEFNQNERPHFADGPKHYPDFQGKVRRVGFLCISEKDTPWRWATILCWSLSISPQDLPHNPIYSLISPQEANTSGISVMFDTLDGFHSASRYSDSTKLSSLVKVGTAPFCPKELEDTIRNGNADVTRVLSSDWGGEIRYLLAVLGLLNARNVAENETVDNTAFNKKRAKKDKSPLCSHTVLKIRAIHRKSFSRPGRPPATPAEIRRHFVVGHWKQRSTGLFWWNTHMRGQTEHGSVSHDYEVTK